ncbi:MAG: hypothetical protein ACI87E_004550 [Mariniblastus sp.]|jgi:hypothetical protein
MILHQNDLEQLITARKNVCRGPLSILSTIVSGRQFSLAIPESVDRITWHAKHTFGGTWR